MANFTATKGAPPKPPSQTKGTPPTPAGQTKGTPPETASRTLKSADDNEQAKWANLNFKMSEEQAQQFRIYCKLIGKSQLEVFHEATQMHRKAHEAELKAAVEKSIE